MKDVRRPPRRRNSVRSLGRPWHHPENRRYDGDGTHTICNRPGEGNSRVTKASLRRRTNTWTAVVNDRVDFTEEYVELQVICGGFGLYRPDTSLCAYPE